MRKLIVAASTILASLAFAGVAQAAEPCNNTNWEFKASELSLRSPAKGVLVAKAGGPRFDTGEPQIETVYMFRAVSEGFWSGMEHEISVVPVTPTWTPPAIKLSWVKSGFYEAFVQAIHGPGGCWTPWQPLGEVAVP